jgi:nitrogen-specific signal transduction histidine kinase
MIPDPELAANCGLTDWTGLRVSVVDLAPQAMAIIEGGTRIVRYANPAFCQLMDKVENQVVGDPFDDLVSKHDKSLTLIDNVFGSGQPTIHMEEEHSRTHPFFWSYAIWPVMVDRRPVGVMMHVIESAHLHEKMLAMNAALMLRSVRQHELTATTPTSNAILQSEITGAVRGAVPVN